MYLRGAVVCILSEVNKKEDKCHFKIFKKITRDRSNRFSTTASEVGKSVAKLEISKESIPIFLPLIFLQL